MIRAEFDKLHPFQKEDFLNEDGIIEDTISQSAPDSSFPHSLPESVNVSGNLPTNELIEEKGVGEDSSSSSQPPIIYTNGFDIADPVELLLMLDENIQRGKENGGIDLHPWQIQIMMDFATGGQSDKSPFQAIVRACNGSGKDKYVIAPCVVWLCMRFKRAIGVVTSASGVQLDNQTCRYIKQLCEAVNTKFKHEIWDCKQRHYRCYFNEDLNDKSEIFCYATDEAGKAEGYHPTDFGAKMGIFVSEDKSVADDINIALNKCTGYTHRMHVSTPGLPMGHFYDYDTTAIPRESIDDLIKVSDIDWIRYLVTASQCSHISASYIEQMKRDLPGGEHGSAFRSQILAEFGTTDEETVIPYIHVYELNKTKREHIKSELNIGGLDLSRGGDETVLSVRNGNKLIAIIPFKFDNNVDTKVFLIQKFNEYNLTHPESYIWTDSGGLGVGIIDELRQAGWTNVKYVNNNWAAKDKRVYKNKGAEMWWNLARLIERKQVILMDDFILTRQLSTRFYKKVQGQQHQLESKSDARSKGRPSPDRADSVVLCFSDYLSESQEVIDDWKAPFEPSSHPKIIPDLDLRSYANSKKEKNAGLPSQPKLSESSFDELREEYNNHILRQKNKYKLVNN